MKCKYCKDTGQVQLLMKTVPCHCKSTVSALAAASPVCAASPSVGSGSSLKMPYNGCVISFKSARDEFRILSDLQANRVFDLIRGRLEDVGKDPDLFNPAKNYSNISVTYEFYSSIVFPHIKACYKIKELKISGPNGVDSTITGQTIGGHTQDLKVKEVLEGLIQGTIQRGDKIC